MPQEQMKDKQVAAYLHLDLREVQKLAQRGGIPCRKIHGEFVFRKGEIDTWVERQMPHLGAERLRAIEKGVSNHHGIDRETMLVWPLIPDGGIIYPLKATSRDAVIRQLVKAADTAGLVYAADILMKEIRDREELCSTAFMPGVALPHPRHPLPYDIEASFVIVGMTASGIPYGSVDGSLTRLFLLICCKDDRTHLHVLARIAQMLDDVQTLDAAFSAGSREELAEILRGREEQVI